MASFLPELTGDDASLIETLDLEVSGVLSAWEAAVNPPTQNSEGLEAEEDESNDEEGGPATPSLAARSALRLQEAPLTRRKARGLSRAHSVSGSTSADVPATIYEESDAGASRAKDQDGVQAAVREGANASRRLLSMDRIAEHNQYRRSSAATGSVSVGNTPLPSTSGTPVPASHGQSVSGRPKFMHLFRSNVPGSSAEATRPKADRDVQRRASLDWPSVSHSVTSQDVGQKAVEPRMSSHRTMPRLVDSSDAADGLQNVEVDSSSVGRGTLRRKRNFSQAELPTRPSDDRALTEERNGIGQETAVQEPRSGTTAHIHTLRDAMRDPDVAAYPVTEPTQRSRNGGLAPAKTPSDDWPASLSGQRIRPSPAIPTESLPLSKDPGLLEYNHQSQAESLRALPREERRRPSSLVLGPFDLRIPDLPGKARDVKRASLSSAFDLSERVRASKRARQRPRSIDLALGMGVPLHLSFPTAKGWRYSLSAHVEDEASQTLTEPVESDVEALAALNSLEPLPSGEGNWRQADESSRKVAARKMSLDLLEGRVPSAASSTPSAATPIPAAPTAPLLSTEVVAQQSPPRSSSRLFSGDRLSATSGRSTATRPKIISNQGLYYHKEHLQGEVHPLTLVPRRVLCVCGSMGHCITAVALMCRLPPPVRGY
ncbi:unnamed protein product [Jaminaea pallidilutea]